MGQPAAKQGDQITATCTHIILVPAVIPVPTPTPHPFLGILQSSLSSNVRVMGRAAATVGSVADNTPPHIPIGGSFSKPPTNKATVIAGSATVMINGKPAARNGDTALTCNDPVDLPVGTVVAAGTVSMG
ncbi:MAG: hypothetical protein C5B56_14150 [Proteobacteria bacterium]|nr:MAG: hypothetical protein C5B56_14150 [Pseudomonadota bacterium]